MERVTLHGKPIKIGDRVWYSKFGWVTVKKLLPDATYPVITNKESFATNGRHYLSDKSPSLFWKEQVFDLSKPLPDLKVDDPIIVWQNERTKYKRYFCNFDESGNVIAYDYGGTSWSVPGKTSHWPNWELPDES